LEVILVATAVPPSDHFDRMGPAHSDFGIRGCLGSAPAKAGTNWLIKAQHRKDQANHIRTLMSSRFLTL
jgi:hypothetical protein